MKLLAEFLQEKLGEDEIEATFTISEYMQYANVKDKEESEVFEELKEKTARLLNYTVTLEDDDYITQSFVRCTIVSAILWGDTEFMIKFAIETLTIRQIRENWLVDVVMKGDK